VLLIYKSFAFFDKKTHQWCNVWWAPLEWGILYVGVYCMLGYIVCWGILHAGVYCMLGYIVCWVYCMFEPFKGGI